jgi:hypothetical protein
MPSDRSPLSWIDRSLGSIAESWIDRSLGSIVASLDRSPSKLPEREKIFDSRYDEMIFWIKDCGLVGYCGRRNHFSEDS